MLPFKDLKSIFSQEKEEIFRDFFTFLRFKSISADPQYKEELFSCAKWLVEYLKKISFKVETWQKKEGAPIIFAEKDVSPEYETVLLYCHYDVQPVDPLHLWTSPPFEPEIRDGKVYARGASDNKGQCFYTIRALKTFLQKKWPLNIKFLIEGEEESGSHSLFEVLKEKKKRLKADHILIVDSGIPKKDKPAITLGARGIVTMTVTITGTNYDLHSGSYGGAVYNPNRALVELLAKTHDEENKVTIPSFYDDIIPLTKEEKGYFDLHFNKKEFEVEFGGKIGGMENHFSEAEAICLRPTLEINGLNGGYGGLGFKTVIPSQALAKISCRLVPNQDPEKIGELVKQFFIDNTPRDLKIAVEIHKGKGEAIRTSPHSKIAKVMSQTYSEVFKKECERILLGGSIPISFALQKAAVAELLLIGVALPTDRIHSPNEHFNIDSFEQGYEIIYKGLELLASNQKEKYNRAINNKKGS